VVSILGLFKMFLLSLLMFIWDNFDTTFWTVYSRYRLRLILYLIEHSFDKAQSLVSSFLRILCHFKMFQHSYLR
jgi:hypothetical protein